ncbi:MAG: thermonuclease family protein [Geobacteraceae bacterium]
MKLKFTCFLPLLLILSFPSLVFAKEQIHTLDGVVIKISDGDTIQLNSGGTKLRIRLFGIDAPETEKRNKRTGNISKTGQPYGNEAGKALRDKIMGQKVKIDVMDIDKYKRLVSLVWLGNRNINQEMVHDGYAWAYRKYLDRVYASEFIAFEERARAKRLGLWQEYNPQPPWEFRKIQRQYNNP